MHQQRLTDEQFQSAGQHLAELVEAFEQLPYPAVRDNVFDLLQTIDALHREALTRLIKLMRAYGGHALIESAANDPVARTLLELYDLVERTPRERADAALDTVRPYLQSHGGEVEVLDVIDGIVHVRLSGSCESCPASTFTVNRRIEAALREALPDITGVRVDEELSEPDVAAFVPLTDIRKTSAAPSVRQIDAGYVDDLPPGSMLGIQLEDERLLLANVDCEIVAYRDQCPGSVAPLSLGTFTSPIVVCPWHNDAFDLRSGKRADGKPGQGLDKVPLLVSEGVIRVLVTRDRAVTGAKR